MNKRMNKDLPPTITQTKQNPWYWRITRIQPLAVMSFFIYSIIKLKKKKKSCSKPVIQTKRLGASGGVCKFSVTYEDVSSTVLHSC